MARSYRVAKPTTGKGQADVVFARGGGGRPPKMPSAPGGLTIDLNLEGMREKSAHRARLKELQDSGLYEGVDLSLIPADKVALLHANLAKDLRSSAEGKLQSDRAREGGTFLQDQARLSGEPPRHFIGSEYERTQDNLAREQQRIQDTPGIGWRDTDTGKILDPSRMSGEKLNSITEDILERVQQGTRPTLSPDFKFRSSIPLEGESETERLGRG